MSTSFPCFQGFSRLVPRPASLKHFFALRLEYEAEKEAVLDRVVALMCGLIHELRQPVARDGRGVVQGEVWKVRWKVMNPAKSEDIFNGLGCDFDDCSCGSSISIHIISVSWEFRAPSDQYFSSMGSVLQSCTAWIKVNKRNPNQLVADGTGALDLEKPSEFLLVLKVQSVKRPKENAGLRGSFWILRCKIGFYQL